MYHKGMISTNFFIFQFQQNWMDLVKMSTKDPYRFINKSIYL